jgi:hypothetical protein
MRQQENQTSAVMQGVGGLLAALLMLTAPWAAAQTEPSPPVPTVTPQLTVPLPNRINRNPAYRADLPEAPPVPVDSRDSSTRPVMPPGSSDGRDTVLSGPGQAAVPGNASSAPRRP